MDQLESGWWRWGQHWFSRLARPTRKFANGHATRYVNAKYDVLHHEQPLVGTPTATRAVLFKPHHTTLKRKTLTLPADGCLSTSGPPGGWCRHTSEVTAA
eukprot:1191089-Prorocentrum_minimum.AAC.1